VDIQLRLLDELCSRLCLVHYCNEGERDRLDSAVNTPLLIASTAKGTLEWRKNKTLTRSTQTQRMVDPPRSCGPCGNDDGQPAQSRGLDTMPDRSRHWARSPYPIPSMADSPVRQYRGAVGLMIPSAPMPAVFRPMRFDRPEHSRKRVLEI